LVSEREVALPESTSKAGQEKEEGWEVLGKVAPLRTVSVLNAAL